MEAIVYMIRSIVYMIRLYVYTIRSAQARPRFLLFFAQSYHEDQSWLKAIEWSSSSCSGLFCSIKYSENLA